MLPGEFTDEYEDWLETPDDPPRQWFDATVGDMPRSPLLCVSPIATVRETVARMAKDKRGSVLVVEEGRRVVGIFTERDLLERVVARGHDPNTTLIRDVMTTEPDTLPEGALLAQALRDMVLSDMRHMPIVDERGLPVAMLSMRDVMSYVSDKFAREIWTAPHRRPSYPPIPDGA